MFKCLIFLFIIFFSLTIFAKKESPLLTSRVKVEKGALAYNWESKIFSKIIEKERLERENKEEIKSEREVKSAVEKPVKKNKRKVVKTRKRKQILKPEKLLLQPENREIPAEKNEEKVVPQSANANEATDDVPQNDDDALSDDDVLADSDSPESDDDAPNEVQKIIENEIAEKTFPEKSRHYPFNFSFYFPKSLNQNKYDTANINLSLLYGNIGNVKGLDGSLSVSIVEKSMTGIQWSGIYGYVGENLWGVQYSGIVSSVYGDMNGVQIGGIHSYTGKNGRFIQGSLIANFVGENFSGLQVSTISNYTGGNFIGFQPTLVSNFTGKDFTGFQVSLVSNYCGKSFDGIQTSLISNYTGGNFSGSQISLISNSAGRKFYGMQLSYISNYNNGDFKGLQISDVVNYNKGNLRGIQLSGIVNMTDSLDGFQAGIVNVSGRTNGIQLGVVNISKNMKGLPIGLVNIDRAGKVKLSFWQDSLATTNVGVKFMVGRAYSLFGVGTIDSAFGKSLVYSGYYGVHLPVERFFVNLDVGYGFLDRKEIFSVQNSSDSKMFISRGGLEYELFGKFSINGGVGIVYFIESLVKGNGNLKTIPVFYIGGDFF